MRVLVTGGSGRLGRWVVRELSEHGHEVVSADRIKPPQEDSRFHAARYVQVETSDLGHMMGAMAGCDAVIHLAAIPAPYGQPDEVVFRANTQGTFNALHAASLLGVRRAVVASSVSALGMAYATHAFTPLYAPVDEAHPLLPQDPYGLSKEVDERTAEVFHRRTGMTVFALRFHWISNPGEARKQAARLGEDPAPHAHNLWGYVDVRDAALACRLGVESEAAGFEAFNITASDTLSETPTEDLIRRYCPATELRTALSEPESAWSIQKARRLLGYDPRHSWRDSEE